MSTERFSTKTRRDLAPSWLNGWPKVRLMWNILLCSPKNTIWASWSKKGGKQVHHHVAKRSRKNYECRGSECFQTVMCAWVLWRLDEHLGESRFGFLRDTTLATYWIFLTPVFEAMLQELYSLNQSARIWLYQLQRDSRLSCVYGKSGRTISATILQHTTRKGTSIRLQCNHKTSRFFCPDQYYYADLANRSKATGICALDPLLVGSQSGSSFCRRDAPSGTPHQT